MTAQGQIEDLLRHTTGIDAASLGPTTVERAVRARMVKCQLSEISDYWVYLRQSEVELSALIEKVVVPETWFFRNHEPFAALCHFVLSEWLPANPNGPLRLLSAPCATGEEPYSMAMALLDAGVQPGRFHIDGVDISADALLQARQATYSRNSFRGPALDFRNRHFQPTPHGQVLHDSVRQQVHFRQSNLAAPDFLSGTECYDVIFCRNVLIYFDTPTQERVIELLDRLLTQKGILFTGHAETGLFVDSAFVSAKLPMTFAYRKASFVFSKESGKGDQKLADKPKRSAPVPNHSPLTARPGVGPPDILVQPGMSSAKVRNGTPSGSAPPSAASEAAPTQQTKLESVMRLADAGRLGEATKLCESCLREHGASAASYYLLGLIQDATGDKQLAGESYRKAIYLEPEHYEALLHLALLSEKLGQSHDAQQWHHRARRVKERGNP